MTFAKKIFIAVFVSTLALGSLLIWTGYHYTVSRSEAEFISRYQVFTRILADTLTRLDTSTETLMLNAAKVVAERDEKFGLLSTDDLRELQSELGITHLFIVDKTGRFLRSTNDDPKRIPNLFSFCENYQKLITGDLQIEATPIIKPNPEPRPFKFLSIPNFDRTRIVEVGVRVDFIAKTLTEAIKSDRNVESMSLFAPDGTPFGTFSVQNVVFEERKADLPEEFFEPIVTDEFVHFYTKVTSSHPRCCQCDASGTSKNGEYYYVLENKVSKNELKALQANARALFWFIGFTNGIFSLLLARLLSRRLVRNIEIAVKKVRKIRDLGGVNDRIRMNYPDEISFLTQEFDRLLDSLEESQRKLVETEKIQSKLELARIVAHNIRSPVIAIEMILPGLAAVPDSVKRVLKNAVSEIKALSEKLKTQSADIPSINKEEMDTDLVFLPVFLKDLVEQKKHEFSIYERSSISLLCGESSEKYFVKVSSFELRSVISNLINNASESYGVGSGRIEIALTTRKGGVCISISDFGVGIPTNLVDTLGLKKISVKGTCSRGFGLPHAFESVHRWGGEIKIFSEIGEGTKIEIWLPTCDQSRPYERSESTFF